MEIASGRVSLGLLLILFSAFVPRSFAQQVETISNVVQITGLAGVKENARGNLMIDQGNLQFTSSKTKAEVAITSIQDVVTGNDSQRVIRGTIGTLSMFAPYGSGRFLSLFRSKLDTLTIQYRDADGGLHGVVFTMPMGKADALKKDLVARGAHTSIPAVSDTSVPETKPAGAKEEKP